MVAKVLKAMMKTIVYVGRLYEIRGIHSSETPTFVLRVATRHSLVGTRQPTGRYSPAYRRRIMPPISGQDDT
jgi:hypothetical protein